MYYIPIFELFLFYLNDFIGMINLFLELNEIIEGTEKDCLDPPKKMISVSKMSDLTDRYDARVITIIILWYFWSYQL